MIASGGPGQLWPGLFRRSGTYRLDLFPSPDGGAVNWFPFYTADFLGATIGLSYLERTTYALMLVMYYELEHPFPPERTRIYRVLGCESDEQRRAVDHVLNEFFIRQDDGWYNKRAEEEIARGRAISGARSEAGKLGRNKQLRGAKARAIAQQMPLTPTPTVTPTSTGTEKQQRARPLCGTRLPPDWFPGPEGTAFCREVRPDLNADDVFEAFRDYWVAQPGQRGVKADWMATWRNWVRKEKVRA